MDKSPAYKAPVHPWVSSGQPAEKEMRSSVQIPRVELQEMGPSKDLSLRRLRPAGADMEHEAFAKVKLVKKKVRSELMYIYIPSLQACHSILPWSHP